MKAKEALWGGEALRRLLVPAAFGALGAVAGYLWWYFVGCDGGCAITSDPVRSTLYGLAVGLLGGSSFRR